VERGELDQVAQRGLDPGVDPHGGPEALAAVDDPVSDEIGIAEPAMKGGAQRSGIDLGARRGQLALGQRLLADAEQAQLDAARAGVDDEDPLGQDGSDVVSLWRRRDDATASDGPTMTGRSAR
jgi:hypothetical protein